MERGHKYTRKIASILGAIFGGFRKKKEQPYRPDIFDTPVQLRPMAVEPDGYPGSGSPDKGHRTPAQRRKRRLRKIANASKRRNRK